MSGTSTNGKAPAKKSKFAGRAISGYQPTYWDRYLFHPALRDGRFNLRDVPAMTQDNAVSIGLLTIFGPLFSAKHEVLTPKGQDPAIKRFIENTLYRFWTHDLGKVLEQYIAYGTAVGEVLYEQDVDTGLWKYAGLDDFNILYGVQAFRRGRHLSRVKISGGPMMMPLLSDDHLNSDQVMTNELKAPKLFWCAHRTTCGQVYGHSTLEAAWGPWGEKCFSHGALSIRKLWCFSNAFRGCWVRYPPGSTNWNGVLTDNQDIARQIAEAAMTGSVGAIPSGTDDQGKPLWEIIDPQQHGDIRGLIDYPTSLNREIWQGMGVLDEVIAAPDVGAALAGHQGPLSGPMKIFLDIENMRVREITTAFDVGPSGYTTRNETSGGVLRNLVLENFGPRAKYEVRALSLIPNLSKEPGAGGSPASAPAAATAPPPGPPQGPMPGMKLSQASIEVEVSDADVTKILGDVSLSDAGGWKTGNDGAFHPIAAGLAVMAADTGRVLMLQRAASEKDRAAGKWEFPGGHIDGREMAASAAQREWQEEVGLLLPDGLTSPMAWEASNGKYAGFIYPIASEGLLDLHHRDMSANPDGDAFEAVAWVNPKDFENHNLRKELLADVTRVRRALRKQSDASLSAGLFDEQEHPRGDAGRFTNKPIDATHVKKAQKDLKAGKLSVQHSPSPITSDASGEQIKHHVTLESGQRVHPDELHRLRVQDGETMLDHDEGLTIREPSGKSKAKSFGDAIHKVSAFTHKPDEPVTIVSKHGYSATRPRSEWMDHDHDGEQSFSSWYDDEGHEHTGRRVEHDGSATEATPEETEDFFEPDKLGHQGRLAFSSVWDPVKHPRGDDHNKGHFARTGQSLPSGSSPIAALQKKKEAAIRDWKEYGTDSASFKDWFGDSKVTDEAGLPKVLFHGTSGESPDFDSFNTQKGRDFGSHFGTTDQAAEFAGKAGRIYPVFLSIHNPLRLPDLGEWDWVSVVPAMRKAGVDIPESVDEERKTKTAGMKNMERRRWERDRLRKIIEDAGYDGIVYLNGAEGRVDWDGVEKTREARLVADAEETPEDILREHGAQDSYIALHPAQIKSAIGNRGTFYSNEDSIAMSAWDPLKHPHGEHGHWASKGEPVPVAVRVEDMPEAIPVAVMAPPLPPAPLPEQPGFMEDVWKSLSDSLDGLFGSEPEAEAPDLALLQFQSFLNTVEDLDAELGKLGIPAWREKDLSQDAAVRAAGWKSPPLLQHLYHQFDQAGHFATLEHDRQLAHRKLNEIGAVIRDLRQAYPKKRPQPAKPARPAHFGKKGAAKINIQAAADHLALGGTVHTAVDHLMQFGGLAKPTARQYVRKAVKLAADQVNGKILSLKSEIAREAG